MKLALLFAVSLLAAPAHAQMISGPARAVDGDTMSMTGFSIRLFGIDAPEANQTCDRQGETWRCGSDAAALLSGLVADAEVICEQRDTDVYGRIVATCRVGRQDLASTMISAGYAVALPAYSEEYVEGAAQAQQQRRGIWASEFQNPADYRAANPSIQRQTALLKSEPTEVVASSSRASVYFRNCNEARAAGAAPLYRGQPGYRPQMDGDNDGIACEPYRGRR